MVHQLTKLITHNFQYKVIAFLLAALFWYLIQGEEILEIHTKMQIRIHVPHGFGIKGSKIRQKAITLQGSRVVLSNMGTNVLEAHIFLPHDQTGMLTNIRVSPQHIRNLNPKVRVKIHNPEEEIFIDKIQTKSLPVVENLKGLPGEGFMIQNIKIEPQMIAVTGLRSDLKKMTQLTTEPLDIAGLSTDSQLLAHIETEIKDPVTLSTEEVSVTINLAKKKINRSFPRIKIAHDQPGVTFTSQPDEVTVTLQGVPDVIEKLSNENIRAFIDLRDKQKGTYTVKAKVQIPPETILVGVEPEDVKVVVTHVEAAEELEIHPMKSPFNTTTGP